jgi:hypothetical protein
MLLITELSLLQLNQYMVQHLPKSDEGQYV